MGIYPKMPKFREAINMSLQSQIMLVLTLFSTFLNECAAALNNLQLLFFTAKNGRDLCPTFSC